MAQASHRFPILDAMRGLAAFSVALYHLHGRGARVNSPHAPLAVDFFFLLSGFVLTSAYQTRLKAGWPFWSFLRLRLIRLYPLYALGLVLGMIAVWRFHSVQHLTPEQWWSRSILALLMLPALSRIADGGWAAFIFNSPSWSLFMEMVANIFHALCLRRSALVLRSVLVVSGLALVWVLLRFGGIWVGAAADNVLFGLPRVMFSYPLGILLFRVWERHRERFKVPYFVPMLVLLAVLQVPSVDRWFDGIVVLIVFPLVLLSGASSELPPRFGVTANVLGQVSYALYVLDEPLMLFWAPMTNRLGWHSGSVSAGWGIPCVATICLVAWLADQWYDMPVRAYLQRRFTTTKRIGVAA